MNKKELINVPRILFPVGTEVLIKGKIVGLKALDDRFVENVVKLAYGEQITAPNDAIYVKDEPETGHADEAPRYVKNILARLRELPLHDREVWLKAIMGEFEKDFSRAKWREGYEQGKFEGMVEREKVKIPQFVADWYEENKDGFEGNLYRCAYNIPSVFDGAKLNEFERWFLTAGTKPFQTLVNMHQFGYEVEKEKRYLVKMKGIEKEKCYLNYNFGGVWLFYNQENFYGYRAHHTRKELEEAGFSEVFNSPLFETVEVE